MNLYRDTRCRNHFGKASVEDYFINQFTLCPLLDPELHMLKLTEDGCEDKNLLMAFIYVRYCKELLDFKFEGGRKIDTDTIKYAVTINEKYPFKEKSFVSKRYSLNNKDSAKNSEKISYMQNELISVKDITEHLLKLYRSQRFRNTFSIFMDDEIYRFAESYFHKTKYHPLQNCFMVIAITKILNDTYVSEETKNRTLSAFFENYSKGNNVILPIDSGNILEKVSDYISARFDVKILCNEYSDLELVHISDIHAKVQKPGWYQNNGTGFVIESNNLCVDMVFRCVTNGVFRITLRGRDVRGKSGDRIPCWIDYTMLQCNEGIVFDRTIPVCHDKPYIYEKKVGVGEELSVHIEWGIHCIGHTNMNNSSAQIEKLQNKIKKLEESRTYKAGKIVTYFPIKVKKNFRKIHSIFR